MNRTWGNPWQAAAPGISNSTLWHNTAGLQKAWHVLQVATSDTSAHSIGSHVAMYVLCLQELEDELAAMRQELAAAQEVAARASSTWDKFRKERDFHRMHHKRVAQEKNRLISDIKRLTVTQG